MGEENLMIIILQKCGFIQTHTHTHTQADTALSVSKVSKLSLLQVTLKDFVFFPFLDYDSIVNGLKIELF